MTTRAILGLLTQTPLHAGASTQVGIIDLPIQREGHSGYPCVFGSSLKGALRDKAEQGILKSQQELPESAEKYAEVVQSDKALVALFGPPPKQAADAAGALIVTDARLLLFPVRSLTSQFKWVTCPDVLRRFQAEAKRLGLAVALDTLDELGEQMALVPDKPGTTRTDLFLEEYRFVTQAVNLDVTLATLAKLMRREQAAESLQRQLVIVNDDSFAHLTNHATPVHAHIALDSLTKTTMPGALWYEESLPPETLLYCGLSANAARSYATTFSAKDVLDKALALFPEDAPYLQVGGNESVGMGWCIVKRLEV